MFHKSTLALALFASLFLSACRVPAALTPKTPTLVFMTDFGTKDSAVAVCKGVMWKVNPHLKVADLTHEIPPFDIEAAARQLEETVPFYPEGTTFVVVVDPGVGSTRRAIAARTKTGFFLVGPDNGVLMRVLELEGLDKAVELKETKYFRAGAMSSTFHGRDIFAPAGAHLASGVALENLGSEIKDLVALKGREANLENGVLQGEISFIEDPFGNVVTNIPRHLVENAGFKLGDTLKMTIGKRAISLPFFNTFSDVAEGKELALYHSRGWLSFSINQGDFAKRHNIKRGEKVLIKKGS